MSKLPIASGTLLKRLQTFEFLRGLDHETLVALSKSAIWKVYTPDAVVFWETLETKNRPVILHSGAWRSLIDVQ